MARVHSMRVAFVALAGCGAASAFAASRSGAHAAPWAERLPDVETTLQMARLSQLIYVYDERAPGFDFDRLCGMSERQMAGSLSAADDPAACAVIASLMDAAPASTVRSFYATARGTEVAVVLSPRARRVAVVFRGTSEPNDALADLKVAKTYLPPDERPAYVGRDPLVHRGFREQYYAPLASGETLEAALFADVEACLAADPRARLLVTGHSLGGALSTLFGVRFSLARRNVDVQVLNFGCPKVGNARFARLAREASNLRMHRVANRRDVVTRAPNIGYRHAGHTLVIDGAPGVAARAYKWHEGLSVLTNWNPLRGSVSDHSIASYIAALRKHAPSATADPEPWVAAYS